ncbi:RagB/SusD family nutrient uptake outer membrane protein [Chitinophaga silvatica]|uniref:RagB/SusD family nutrient uptake outer membrane protein n=1 Tax=Chitinophaga silvatica TaxID=2282649 RepID=A0A3E1Y7M5_9BACT|nr:RagB/SusD family nutrient uptake outer membrane protein [Chitinophaga silvatica]RFS21052.1 RagB/SusD family nutrient uptake outer membrane protein [Chitinophaga silvatica]
MKRIFLKIFVLTLAVSSCTKDLNRVPTNSSTANVTYSTLEGYKQVLAKVYGSFALAGNNGINASDLAGIDPGQADFLRLFWNAQELPTEEAACVWNDPGIPDFHNMNWTSNNVLLAALYNRSLFHVTVANEFLRESGDDKIAARGFSGKEADDIKTFRAEARFLRAFQYWVLMDLFANPPFVTEKDPIGKFIPPQTDRTTLFKFVESELLAIESVVAKPKLNEYARVDQAAVWALLARIYLNAEVYLGKGNAKYTEAITYSSKVIGAGYALKTSYQGLFLADNDVDNPEIILPIAYDGEKTQNNGGTTFIINASVNPAMNAAQYGVQSGWGGNRSTKALPELFGDYSGATDKRAFFFGDKPEIDNPAEFTDGLRVIKFRNKTSAGQTPPSPGNAFCSVDFPLFRLAEQYLIYAEAVKRGGAGGNDATALGYLNALRERAYGNKNGNISSYNLDYILDERGRELYWEAFRRTDLIRFEKFTSSNYVWPWKGGVKSGKGVEDFRTLYPLPATDLTANPTLKQNKGY